jgi:hypothetical protein
MRAHLGLCLILVTSSCIDDETSSDEQDVDLDAATSVQRGADRAGEFSVREARILAGDHGVKWSGVYIGGACNGGFGWSKRGVTALARATHWKFMPIWVGQQTSSICHAHSLTYAQGTADGRAAAHRMATFGWNAHRGIPVVLDVEAGTYENHPKASTSYLHGWVRAVHAAGYKAYVYSSPFGVSHYHDANIGVDAAWVASFFYSSFHHLAPGDLHQIGSRYTHHNRAWQYAGDFNVAGVGRVDASTSNLVLAPAPGGTNVKKTAAGVDDDDDLLDDDRAVETYDDAAIPEDPGVSEELDDEAEAEAPVAG